MIVRRAEFPIIRGGAIRRNTACGRPDKANPGGHSAYRGFKLLFRDSRFNALDLASLDALHANANANVLAVDGGANRLQVRAEGALIANM